MTHKQEGEKGAVSKTKPDPEITQMTELTDKDFKTASINKNFKYLKKKMDIMSKQLGNLKREVKTIKIIWKFYN